MHIYLDESGDLGFNFKNIGTPRYFIITILVCKNSKTVTQIKHAVKRTLRNKLNLKKSKFLELKGTDTTLAIKQYFYHHTNQSDDWHLYSIILDKPKLKDLLYPLPSEYRIYNYLSKEILKTVSFDKVESKILLIIDKRKGRKNINEFNKYLSKHLKAILPLNILYDISHEQSHENHGLQAVDLFCWGIYRFYEHGDDSWFSFYKHRLTTVESRNYSEIKKDGP